MTECRHSIDPLLLKIVMSTVGHVPRGADPGEASEW